MKDGTLKLPFRPECVKMTKGMTQIGLGAHWAFPARGNRGGRGWGDRF